MNPQQTLTPMPDGFYWKPRCQLDKLPTGLFLDAEIVVSMLERVDGTWFARLHLDDDFPQAGGNPQLHVVRGLPARR